MWQKFKLCTLLNNRRHRDVSVSDVCVSCYCWFIYCVLVAPSGFGQPVSGINPFVALFTRRSYDDGNNPEIPEENQNFYWRISMFRTSIRKFFTKSSNATNKNQEPGTKANKLVRLNTEMRTDLNDLQQSYHSAGGKTFIESTKNTDTDIMDENISLDELENGGSYQSRYESFLQEEQIPRVSDVTV